MTDLRLPVTRTRGCCQVLEDPLSPKAVEDTAAILKVLSDPTRIRMLTMLARAPAPICVCDFTAAFDLGQPTVSHHLGKLRDIGVVTSSKQGIWAFYELAAELPPLAQAILGALEHAAGLAESRVAVRPSRAS